MAECPESDDVTSADDATVMFDDDPIRAIAEVYKNKGNDEYSKKNFHSALFFYTGGINVNCKDKELTAKLHSNRAAAHLNLGNYTEALSDAEITIGLQPSFLKAFVRGATACLQLKQFNEAITWCEKGLAIDPNNQKLLELRIRSMREKKHHEGEKKTCTMDTFKTGKVNTCKKPDNVTDRSEEGKAYGVAYKSLADFITVIADQENSVKIAEELSNKSGEETANGNHGIAQQRLEDVGNKYGNLGNAYYSLGDFKTVIEYQERHLRIAKELGDRPGEEKAYSNLGNAFYSVGDFQRAVDYHERHLKIAKELGDRSGEGKAYCNLGNAYHSLGDFRKAVEYQERHLRIAKELGDRSGEGKAYGNLGNAYHSLGDFRKAVEYQERHLRIAKELGDRSGEEKAYGSLGIGHCSLGDYKMAIEYFKDSLNIARELGDIAGEGVTYCNLGNAYHSLGDFKTAIDYHNRHLTITLELGDKWGKGNAYNNLGHAHRSLGDLKTAIGYLKRHLTITRELSDRSEEGRTYGSLGCAHHSLGDFQKALEYHERHLKIARELGDRSGEGKAYGNLGIGHCSLGDFKTAVQYHELDLTIAKELGDRSGEGRACGNLGSAHLSLGDFKTAIDYLERDLKIAKELGDTSGEGRTYGNLGIAYCSLGDFETSVNFHERQLKIVKELGDRCGEGKAYGNLGIAYHSLGKFQTAIDYHERHMNIAKELGDRSGEGRANGNLGMAHFRLQDFKKAIEYLERDLKISRDLGDRSGLGRAYGNLGIVYKELRDFRVAKYYLERSLEVAKELRDLIGEGKAYFNLGSCFEDLGQVSVASEFYQRSITLFDNIRDRLQLNDKWKISLRDQYQTMYAALWRLMLSEGKVMDALFFVEQGRAQSLKDLMGLNYESVLNNGKSEYRTLNELVSRIPSNTIFMAFGENELFFWVSQEEKEFKLRRKQISSQEVQAHQLCLNESALNKLYDSIIHPIRDLFLESELIIIPEGALFMIPFAALKDKNCKYLCESFRIRVCPSLTTLKLIADCPAEYHCKSGVLLVGDPWVQDVTMLPTLPYARKEVEMIGRLLDCAPLVGRQATKVEVLRRLGSVALVHIAAHGSMKTGEITLAPDNDEVDFILTMKDVLSIQVHARLVVLSCCHSGHGEIKAEGVVGIARAFLGAGARSVLVSLWEIDDIATLTFMKHFYERLVQGKSASEALQQTMKCMRESVEFGAVKYWAPFVLIGDDVTLNLSGCE